MSSSPSNSLAKRSGQMPTPKLLAPNASHYMQDLTFLSLASTAIADAGLCALSPYLMRLHQLSHLNLADTSLTAAAAKPLAAVLAPLATLNHLDLSGNAFDVAGHVALAPVLATLTELTFLDNVGGKFSMRAPAPPTVCPPALFKLQQLGLQVCAAIVAIVLIHCSWSSWMCKHLASLLMGPGFCFKCTTQQRGVLYVNGLHADACYSCMSFTWCSKCLSGRLSHPERYQ